MIDGRFIGGWIVHLTVLPDSHLIFQRPDLSWRSADCTRFVLSFKRLLSPQIIQRVYRLRTMRMSIATFRKRLFDVNLLYSVIVLKGSLSEIFVAFCLLL